MPASTDEEGAMADPPPAAASDAETAENIQETHIHTNTSPYITANELIPPRLSHLVKKITGNCPRTELNRPP